jgi:hypothetical protein
MNAIRLHHKRKVGMIVDDKAGAGFPGHFPNDFTLGVFFAHFFFFLPVLDQPYTGIEHLPDDVNIGASARMFLSGDTI